jgi:hypothetical protein
MLKGSNHCQVVNASSEFSFYMAHMSRDDQDDHVDHDDQVDHADQCY